MFLWQVKKRSKYLVFYSNLVNFNENSHCPIKGSIFFCYFFHLLISLFNLFLFLVGQLQQVSLMCSLDRLQLLTERIVHRIQPFYCSSARKQKIYRAFQRSRKLPLHWKESSREFGRKMEQTSQHKHSIHDNSLWVCIILVSFCCLLSFFQQQMLLGIKVLFHALHLTLQPGEKVCLLLPLLTGIPDTK